MSNNLPAENRFLTFPKAILCCSGIFTGSFCRLDLVNREKIVYFAVTPLQ